VTVYTIRFEGPAVLAVGVATALADADGVDLTSSAAPSVLDADTVELILTAEGTPDDIAGAVADIKSGLPHGASIEITNE
jgi:hypothetical protein